MYVLGHNPASSKHLQILDDPDYSLVKALQTAQQNFVITDASMPDNPIVFASNGFLEVSLSLLYFCSVSFFLLYPVFLAACILLGFTGRKMSDTFSPPTPPLAYICTTKLSVWSGMRRGAKNRTPPPSLRPPSSPIRYVKINLKAFASYVLHLRLTPFSYDYVPLAYFGLWLVRLLFCFT